MTEKSIEIGDEKSNIISKMLASEALWISPNPGENRILKNGRPSPWFFNAGKFNDGKNISILGEAYSNALINSGIEVDSLYGIPEKGSALVVATAMELAKKGKNYPWFFTRKVAKEYGEGTGLSAADIKKALVVGQEPEDGQRIAQFDDVFTSGETKYDAIALLNRMGNFRLPVTVIAVDRQEIDVKGINAIEEYESNTGIKVASIMNASEIFQYLKEKFD